MFKTGHWFKRLYLRKINGIWKELGVRQRCKLDTVDVGQNWNNFRWPSNEIKPKRFKSVGMLVLASLRFSMTSEKREAERLVNVLKMGGLL